MFVLLFVFVLLLSCWKGCDGLGFHHLSRPRISSLTSRRLSHSHHHRLEPATHPTPTSPSTTTTTTTTAVPPIYSSASPCRIKVIGVGGGGGNAVNRMFLSMARSMPQLQFYVVNTDAQVLDRSDVPNRLHIGTHVSRGLGAGGVPSVGRKAAEESYSEIEAMVRDADLVFVTAGMGGGTGSGAAPIVAQCARDAGALTVGVVTKPFAFEGRRRMQQAETAIAELKSSVDTLLVVSNDKLLQIVPAGTPLSDAFALADEVIRQGVVGISDIIVRPGLVNVDFADVRSVLADSGLALIGIGRASTRDHGNNNNNNNMNNVARAVAAAEQALQSPLLASPITEAKGVVFHVTGGADVSLHEIQAAAEVIHSRVHPQATVIFGATVDDTTTTTTTTSGEITITVLATGFRDNESHQQQQQSQQRQQQQQQPSLQPARNDQPQKPQQWQQWQQQQQRQQQHMSSPPMSAIPSIQRQDL